MIADVVCVANAIVEVSYELVTWVVVGVGRKNVGIFRRINVDDFDVDVEAGTNNLLRRFDKGVGRLDTNLEGRPTP